MDSVDSRCQPCCAEISRPAHGSPTRNPSSVWGHLSWVGVGNIHGVELPRFYCTPNNPCMVYLPTFTIKIFQMSVNIPHMDDMGTFFFVRFLKLPNKKIVSMIFCANSKPLGFFWKATTAFSFERVRSLELWLASELLHQDVCRSPVLAPSAERIVGNLRWLSS